MKSPDTTTDIEKTVSETELNDRPSLKSCAPVNSVGHLSPPASVGELRRSRRDETFTTAAEPTVIACIVGRKRDGWGNLSIEEYYPVTGELQKQVGSTLRSVAFHPCTSGSGDTFIYPQKLDPPDSWANSWNASLAQALSHPPGQWRRIWSDKEAECYQYDLVSPLREGIPEYPGFTADLEKALSPNIITSLDDPKLQRLLDNSAPDSDEEVY